MSPPNCGKEGRGGIPSGTSPLSPGIAGSRGVLTKTWDMRQWEHNSASWDIEQQRCHSPINNRTWHSGDILSEPWDMKQQGCPRQAMGCGTVGMSLSHGTWVSRDVCTDPWDMDVHRVQVTGCRAVGMCSRAVGQRDVPLQPRAVHGGEGGSAPTLGSVPESPVPCPHNGLLGFPATG